MTLKDFLFSLQGGMIEIAVGVVLSFLVEYVPGYEQLAKKWKRLVVMGACITVPVLAAAASAAMGYLPWNFETTFWPAIYAGGAVFFGTQAAHLRELGRLGRQIGSQFREVDRLAEFLLKYYPNEIGAGDLVHGESAVDVAIRLLSPVRPKP